MSEKIQKLNRLKNPESFVQVDTVKGFTYLDKSGEIANRYESKDKSPTAININIDGMVIVDPTDKIKEIKVSPLVVWAKFINSEPLDYISRLYVEEANAVLSILEVSEIKRIGWRNYFIYEFNNKEDQEKYFEKLTKLNRLILFLRYEIETSNDFKANLSIQPVIKNNTEKTPGVLFDIDLYQTKDIDVKNISKILANFRKFLNSSKGFLEAINETFL
jgi:hypothetical protein